MRRQGRDRKVAGRRQEGGGRVIGSWQEALLSGKSVPGRSGSKSTTAGGSASSVDGLARTLAFALALPLFAAVVAALLACCRSRQPLGLKV